MRKSLPDDVQSVISILQNLLYWVVFLFMFLVMPILLFIVNDKVYFDYAALIGVSIVVFLIVSIVGFAAWGVKRNGHDQGKLGEKDRERVAA